MTLCFLAPSQMWAGICLWWELLRLRLFKLGQLRDHFQLQIPLNFITHCLLISLLIQSITDWKHTGFCSGRSYSEACFGHWSIGTATFWFSIVAQVKLPLAVVLVATGGCTDRELLPSRFWKPRSTALSSELGNISISEYSLLFIEIISLLRNVKVIKNLFWKSGKKALRKWNR